MYEALIGLLGIILGALATFARERAKQNARAGAAALSITVELRTNAAKASNVVSRAETHEPSAQVATATAHTSGGAPTTKPDAELGKSWWVGDLATEIGRAHV